MAMIPVEHEGRTFLIPAFESECAMKHFVKVIKGDGSGSVSFYTPFAPDIISIVGLDYNGIDGANVDGLLYLVCAPKCNGKLSACGAAIGGKDSALKSLQYGGISQRYTRDENGMNTIHDLAYNSSGGYAYFVEGQEYIIVAGKKTENSES